MSCIILKTNQLKLLYLNPLLLKLSITDLKLSICHYAMADCRN